MNLIMGGFVKNPRIGWYILFSGFIIAFLLFIPMNKMVLDLKGEEQKKIELWANAVSNKAQVVKTTQDFYNRVEEVEHTRIQQFIEAYKIIMSQNQDADLSSPELRFYTKIIMDNKTIPVIITDEFNNITLSQNVEIPKGQNVLVGDLYKKFSLNAPYEYEIYGMKFKLYYAESDVYLNLKKILTGITGSFLEEITDNTVFAPVVITDSSKNRILAYGNIDDKQIQSGNVRDIIKDMHNFDNPIKTALLDNGYGYIYYQTNPALMWLRYYPFIYIYIFTYHYIIYKNIPIPASGRAKQRLGGYEQGNCTSIGYSYFIAYGMDRIAAYES